MVEISELGDSIDASIFEEEDGETGELLPPPPLSPHAHTQSLRLCIVTPRGIQQKCRLEFNFDEACQEVPCA